MTTKIGAVTKRRYDRLVKEGRGLVAQQTYSQFKLGENALEIEPLRSRHGGPVAPGDEILTVEWGLRMYAEDVGIPESTLADYRWVASRWPEEFRAPDVSYYIHKIFAGVGDADDPTERHDLILDPPEDERTGELRWTVDSAARWVGWRPSHAESEQERVERIHDLAKDDAVATRVITDFLRRPTVAYEAMADHTARHAVNAAQIDRTRDALDRVRRSTPAVRRTEHSAEYVDLVGTCQQFVAAASRLVPALRGNDFTDEERERVHANTVRVRATADWIESAVDTGNVGMDDELARLLGGE
ncbi:hypothetical protein NN3_35920 [Nocardia neocaledoniensis NBRC 108232]|uniref:RacO protein n=1 Tax=Nocardia neocaledoniensis TaxID=236511 RepID=A0A317NCG3_9NOCA|nr:DUF6192 family protein [Nocardia neocaledoniensis]PWV72742.1 hypothetical protein DFR69_10851 [Nocardia neocaledoniensis]GEM32585.1 hypothetical protein NN3_35920 [Nocardia neocaledoniensis NBRC 108232]